VPKWSDGVSGAVSKFDHLRLKRVTDALDDHPPCCLGPRGARISLLLDNESWSFAWIPDVRYGIEKLYQAFQLHTHHLHQYELVVP
jgi:hypothetical protein